MLHIHAFTTYTEVCIYVRMRWCKNRANFSQNRYSLVRRCRCHRNSVSMLACILCVCVSLGIHLCVKHEHTATYYCVYMIIMAVYVQHLEIVDPFYIDSRSSSGSSQQQHRHQIEVKYNIIKPSSFCMSGSFLFGCCCCLCLVCVFAKIKSRECKETKRKKIVEKDPP